MADRNVESNSQQEGDGLIEKVVDINRVAKTVKGGRTFSFAALTVTGDGHSKVGYGYGKAKEVPASMQKASEASRKNMTYVQLNGDTVHYKTVGQHGACRVHIMPAPEGTGVIAGGAMRAVFEALGVKNVIAKIVGSRNPLNVVRATIKALNKMTAPEDIAAKRGKTLAEIKE